MKEDFKKEYFYNGNDTACILIHGFTGTPGELRELGEALHNVGLTVNGVRLKGHGTKVEDMLDCKYMDWVESALSEYRELKKTKKKVYIIGHSMGALIALYIAENFPVDKLILLSPPLIGKDKLSNMAFIIKYFMKYSSWKPREFTSEQQKYILGYDSVPLKSVDEFNKLNKVVKKNLKKVTAPTLIINSNADAIVDPKSVDLLLSDLSSEVKETVFLKESGHLIAVEGEKDITIKEVLSFINKD